MTTLLEKNLKALVNDQPYELLHEGIARVGKYGKYTYERAIVYWWDRTSPSEYIQEHADLISSNSRVFMMRDCYIVYGAKVSAGRWRGGSYRVSDKRRYVIVRVKPTRKDCISHVAIPDMVDGGMHFLNLTYGKRADVFKVQYMSSTAMTLDDAYKKPSERKRIVHRSLIELMERLGGYCPRIISHNGQTFTFAFNVVSEDGIKCLIVFTPSKTYAIRW